MRWRLRSGGWGKDGASGITEYGYEFRPVVE